MIRNYIIKEMIEKINTPGRVMYVKTIYDGFVHKTDLKNLDLSFEYGKITLSDGTLNNYIELSDHSVEYILIHYFSKEVTYLYNEEEAIAWLNEDSDIEDFDGIELNSKNNIGYVLISS